MAAAIEHVTHVGNITGLPVCKRRQVGKLATAIEHATHVGNITGLPFV